jgi:trimethylamine---corrinoid protein Co-methyltransferase
MTRETGRERRTRERGGQTVRQLPWRRLENPWHPLELLDADQVERVHAASMRLLSDYGLEFQSEEALAVLARNGARVDTATGLIRFPPEVVEHWVAQTPRTFTVYSRNPDRPVTLGERHLAFASVGGPPNCSDLDRGRRPGTYTDQCEIIRLIGAIDAVHIGGGAPVEAIDLPAETRHLDTAFAFLTLTDKPFYGRAIGRTRITDALRMVAIARGLEPDPEGLRAIPGLLSVVNVNSPRRVDREMAAGLMELARWGQPVIVTPFTLQGAMSPVTLAGALVQQNAEALAVIALAQMTNPGTPVMYGGFTSNVDMRTGAPAFGTPEYARAVIAGGQLARRYGLPYRSSNVNASNAVDAQAAYESEMSLWAALLGGANLVHHAAGWLEGGLCASFEKLVLDAELLQMAGELLRPVTVDEDELALAAHTEVPPGGHFFGAGHTLARFETAFYRPLLSDWRNHEAWREAGGLDATQRANKIWKALLAAYAPPPLEPGRREALEAYVARRKEEIAREGL